MISIANIIHLIQEVATKLHSTGNVHQPAPIEDDEQHRGNTISTDPGCLEYGDLATLTGPESGAGENTGLTTAPRLDPPIISIEPGLTTTTTQSDIPEAQSLVTQDGATVGGGEQAATRTEAIMTTTGNTNGGIGGSENDEEDWERKYDSDNNSEEDKSHTSLLYVPLTRCHACNKLDANIEQCDHCELPHHFDCLMKEPNDGTNRYCNSCINTLYGENQQTLSQPGGINSDLELSEPESSSGDSEVSEFIPNSEPVAKPPAGSTSTMQDTAPKYQLRTRTKPK